MLELDEGRTHHLTMQLRVTEHLVHLGQGQRTGNLHRLSVGCHDERLKGRQKVFHLSNNLEFGLLYRWCSIIMLENLYNPRPPTITGGTGDFSHTPSCIILKNSEGGRRVR